MLFEEENSGLLGATDSTDELLVFGYGCKLFRDDEQAARVNRGATLIPWQGDKTLMIDRYDCRGSLLDRSEFVFEGPFKPYQDENEEIERLCEEERYADLRSDVIEKRQGLEEIHKRSAAPSVGYAEVDFKYAADNQADGPSAEELAAKKAIVQQDKLYEAPPDLKVPKDMETPRYHRLHVIMERTAAFVARHGSQMEIVLKAKQAQNTQFHFLDFGHYLNPYYRHLLKSISNGLYKPTSSRGETDEDDEETKSSVKGTMARQDFVPVTVHAREVTNDNADHSSSSEDSDSDDGGGFGLHPSLFAASRLAKEDAGSDKAKLKSSKNDFQQASKEKKSAEEPYSERTEKKGPDEGMPSKGISSKEKEESDRKKTVSAQDLVAMRLAAACAPVARSTLTMVPISTQGQSTQQSLAGTGGSERRHEDSAAQSRLEAQADHFIEDELTEEWPTREMLEAAEEEEVAHSLTACQANSLDGEPMMAGDVPGEHSQAVAYQDVASYGGNPYTYHPYSQVMTDAYGQPIYSDPATIAYMQTMDPAMAQAFAGMDPQLVAALLAPPPPPPDELDDSSAVQSSVAGYPYMFQPPPPPDDEDCSTPELPNDCPSPPPPEVRLIINKLAEYVARNGHDFEEGIIAKRDPRFAFVERGKPHHVYYLWQCHAKLEELNEKVKREPKPIASSETSTRLGTVSFKVFKVSDRGSRTLQPGVQFSDSESESESESEDIKASVGRGFGGDEEQVGEMAPPSTGFSYAGYRPVGGDASSADWQQYDWQGDENDGRHEEVLMERRRRAAAFRDMMVRAGSGAPPPPPSNPNTGEDYDDHRDVGYDPVQSGQYAEHQGKYYYDIHPCQYEHQLPRHDESHFQARPQAPEYGPPDGGALLPNTVHHGEPKAPPPSSIMRPPSSYPRFPHDVNPVRQSTSQLAAPPPNRYPMSSAAEMHNQAPPPAVALGNTPQTQPALQAYAAAYAQPPQAYAAAYQAQASASAGYSTASGGFSARVRSTAHISSAPVRYKQADANSSATEPERKSRAAVKGSSVGRDRSRSPI